MASSKGVGPEILRLTAEGLSGKEIALRVGCSFSTVRYHLTSTRKENMKRYEKERKDRGDFYHLFKRFWNAKKRKNVNRSAKPIRDHKIPEIDCSMKARLRNVGINYIGNSERYKLFLDERYKLFLDKVNSNPVCYLTGRKIDLMNDPWQLDHVVPKAKNGDNSLENMSLTTREANSAKGDMYLDDFVNLCVDVCKNFGYKVTKE